MTIQLAASGRDIKTAISALPHGERTALLIDLVDSAPPEARSALRLELGAVSVSEVAAMIAEVGPSGGGIGAADRPWAAFGSTITSFPEPPVFTVTGDTIEVASNE